MKKFLANIWYTILYQFDNHREEIPNWWYYVNKSFEDYPVKLQRIEVAKDVLFHINSNRYNPRTGRYIDNISSTEFEDVITPGIDFYHDRISVKDKFHTIRYCDVCALGACILSITKFKNRLMLSDLHFDKIYKADGPVQKLLLSVFTPLQIAMIEAAFESGYNNFFDTRVAKKLKAEQAIDKLPKDIDDCTRLFFAKYSNSHERLRAIMQNIIDNDGEFKL